MRKLWWVLDSQKKSMIVLSMLHCPDTVLNKLAEPQPQVLRRTPVADSTFLPHLAVSQLLKQAFYQRRKKRRRWSKLLLFDVVLFGCDSSAVAVLTTLGCCWG